MFDLDNWQEIMATISRNKFRSFLTGVGVLWGIFMLLGLLAIANGFRGGVYTLVDGFEKNACFFSSSITSEAYMGYKKGRYWTMNNKDVKLIKNTALSVDDIAPGLIDIASNKNIIKDNNSGSFNIRGIYPSQFLIEKQNLLHGRLFSNVDVEYEKKVCIIGKEVYEALFSANEDPIGQYIQVKGFNFKVIGVISPVSQISIGGDVQLTVFMPFSTMQRLFNKGDVVHYIACTAKEGFTADMLENEVKALLQKSHAISPTDEKAIKCFNAEAEFMSFHNLFEGVDFLIWIVGLGSLLSGVIGVSNIMLVTVRERTREIGIRRALGASPFVIVRQVMSESFVLTTIFGLIGIIISVWVLKFARIEMSKYSFEDVLFRPPFVSFEVVLAAFGVLCLAGLVSGLIPSLRAMSIKAIDAIREE